MADAEANDLERNSEGILRNEIKPGLLNNLKEFDNPFFKQFALRPARKPLKLSDSVVKNYLFPTLYSEVTTAILMLFCDYERAQDQIPSRLKPVSLGLGRALVVVSSYHYKKVNGMAPYNEVAFSIPVLPRNKRALPLLPLLQKNFDGLGYYVLSMPVTSLENQLRGKKIWGLKKVAQRIQLRVEKDDYLTTVFDSHEKPYMEFRVPLTGKTEMFKQSTRLYSELKGDLLKSISISKGMYAVNQFPQTLALPFLKPSRPYLEFGKSSAAKFLRDLKIHPQPFQCRFSDDVQSVFDLPEVVS